MSFNSDYLKQFEGEYCNEKSIQFVAFQTALDTRKFEIELYWKRAAYFWAFIAASFAGFFLVSSRKDDLGFFPFIISCLGAFFTFAFYCVNKGSKYWQENWENHVAVLGKEIVGPLFGLILERPSRDSTLFDRLTDPTAISVSKINQWVSLYLLMVWSLLMLHSSPASHFSCLRRIEEHPYWVVFISTLVFAIAMRVKSKTSFGPHTPERHEMVTQISK